jgi:hypothetical protein
MVRRSLVALAVASVLLAGCTGGTSESPPPIVADASPATLDDATLSATGYEHVSTTRGRLNTTVSARIQGDVTLSTTRRVNATTVTAIYRRETDTGPVVATLYSVPAVQPFENANLTKNPASGREAAAFVADYDVSDVEETGSRRVTLLGNETTLTTFAARGTANGRSVAVRLTRVTVRHDGDYVTVVVVTPRGVDSRLDRLLRGVAH